MKEKLHHSHAHQKQHEQSLGSKHLETKHEHYHTAAHHDHHGHCKDRSELSEHTKDHRAHHGHSNDRKRHHGHLSEKSTNKKLKRLFERGDLQLLILSQLQQASSHGYELIKSINRLTHGLYEPSPGVVYPTLAMLEDQGLIKQEITDNSKKMYLITQQGILHLQDYQTRFAILKERLSCANHMQENTNFSQAIDDAIKNFKMLMRHQLRHEQLSPIQVEKIVSIIHHATQEIEKVTKIAV